MATQTRPRWTFEDYFAWEAEQPTRHEFVDGEVYAMTGGTDRHARVIIAAAALLWAALRGRRCVAYSTEMKLRVEASGNSHYPDAFVNCDPATRQDRGVATDATVIVEVLSPGTAAYDRGRKFDDYRLLPSLAHYVLIDPAALTVERHFRDAGGWRLGERQARGVLELTAFEVDIALADLFEGLGDPLPPVDAPPPGRVDPHAD